MGRPSDPLSVALVEASARRLAADATFGAGGLNAALFSLLAAAVGALAGWEAIRLRPPLPTLAPVAAGYSIGLLNAFGDRFLPTLAFLALLLGLCVVNGFGRARRTAGVEGLRVTGAARGRFLAVGAALAIGVVALAGVVPPLTSRDSSGIFDAGLTRLRVALGDTAPGTSVGFSFDVGLNGQLVSNSEVVLTYNYDGPSPIAAPLYLRGVNLPLTASGQWRQQGGQNIRVVPAGGPIGYGETYRDQVVLTTHVRVLNPPPIATGLVFYPGALVSSDTGIAVTGPMSTRGGRSLGTFTVDEIQALTTPVTSYTVETTVSTATEKELIEAGVGYPPWVLPYGNFGFGTFGGNGSYRGTAELARTRTLAQRVTVDATTPYEKARAIESYLRGNFNYTLTPPPTPRGRDPIDYFLFSSRSGYCQFYATAMGDMLRSLGIPTRLVNGFGPGGSIGPGGDYTVTAADAHTWVEVYFPSYGWIAFEPTPQLGYSALTRGPAVAADSSVSPSPDPTPTVTPAASDSALPNLPPAPLRKAPTGSGNFPWPLLLLIALILAAGLGGAAAWRPRSIEGAWTRTRLLGGLAGVERHDSDTPEEFGRRLVAAYPDLAPAVAPFVAAYAEAAYSSRVPPAARSAVLDGWRRIGSELLLHSLRRRGR